MKYEGCVEGVHGGEIVGWCLARDVPYRPQFVSIYDGDALIGTAIANIHRPDLLKVAENGNHGFSFAVPDRYADGVVRSLSIFAGPGVEELPGSPVRIRLERMTQAPAAPPRPARQYAPKRAAVVCWDLSHNPVGRAHILYKLLEPDWKVELIGPIWQRFGRDLWPPLKNEELTVKSFHPSGLADVWREGAAIALAQSYDLVIICKPRLPSLVLGLLIAEQSRCPIIIDIDENERAFNTRRPGVDAARELLEEPFQTAGTDLAQQFLRVADAMTVSNPTLQMHFPGRLVRHARNEAEIRANRELARMQFGFKDTDFVIAFIGTARAHKGLSHIFSALAAGADRDVKLLLAGSIPKEMVRAIQEAGLGERVIRHDEFDLAQLGLFLAAADLVPVLQDLDTEIAQTQMPAKFTDALLYGVRIVASDAPPFRDMAARGVVDIIRPEEFAEYLARIRSEPSPDGLREQRRRVFEEEFSFVINRQRLSLAIQEAFRHFDFTASTVRNALGEILAKTRLATASGRDAGRPPRSGTLDIAFFWKQNDSDLFGRRSDMVVKYLLNSGRVRKIVHFDHAVGIPDLRNMARAKSLQRMGVAAMQLPRTVDRALQLADEQSLERRLFIRRENAGSAESFAGRPLGEEYAEFVSGALRDAGMEPGRTVAWVCPVVHGFHALNERLGFRRIVADLIDDQRTWASSDQERANLHAQYESTLRIANHVFTNCEGNRERFAWARADIMVVPNGAEIHFPAEILQSPKLLRTLPRPIIGYLGNLRERIDWELVRNMARERPNWSFVLAGPVEEDRLPDWVRGQPNLVLPGPVPYEASRAWIGTFDVAIMPHLRSPMTEAMNPLKLYNYLAAGVPVVTTPVANIGDLVDLVACRETPEDFIAAIEEALSSPRGRISRERLQTFSWEQRVSDMLDRIEN